MSASTTATLRHDWSLAEVKALFVRCLLIDFVVEMPGFYPFDPGAVPITRTLS